MSFSLRTVGQYTLYFVLLEVIEKVVYLTWYWIMFLSIEDKQNNSK